MGEIELNFVGVNVGKSVGENVEGTWLGIVVEGDKLGIVVDGKAVGSQNKFIA